MTATATNRAQLSLNESGGGCGEACGPYPFGSWAAGTPPGVQRDFTAFNTGALDANPLSWMTGDATAFGVVPSTSPAGPPGCTAVLTPGSVCALTVTFHPPAMTTYNSALILNYSDALGGPGSSVSRSLTGTGN